MYKDKKNLYTGSKIIFKIYHYPLSHGGVKFFGSYKLSLYLLENHLLLICNLEIWRFGKYAFQLLKQHQKNLEESKGGQDMQKREKLFKKWQVIYVAVSGE